MEKELTVGQVMAPIEEYNTIYAEAPLCDALLILKANLKKIESQTWSSSATKTKALLRPAVPRFSAAASPLNGFTTEWLHH